jgi:hypothetical protein
MAGRLGPDALLGAAAGGGSIGGIRVSRGRLSTTSTAATASSAATAAATSTGGRVRRRGFSGPNSMIGVPAGSGGPATAARSPSRAATSAGRCPGSFASRSPTSSASSGGTSARSIGGGGSVSTFRTWSASGSPGRDGNGPLPVRA